MFATAAVKNSISAVFGNGGCMAKVIVIAIENYKFILSTDHFLQSAVRRSLTALPADSAGQVGPDFL